VFAEYSCSFFSLHSQYEAGTPGGRSDDGLAAPEGQHNCCWYGQGTARSRTDAEKQPPILNTLGGKFYPTNMNLGRLMTID